MSASNGEGATKTRRAIDRAAVKWREAALFARYELRAEGVTGELRYLNDTAKGKRGVAAPHQIHTLADKMAESGLPEDTAVAALSSTTGEIVRMAYAARRAEGSAA